MYQTVTSLIQIIKNFTVSTRIVNNFAATTMTLESQNNGSCPAAAGFDVTILTEELISNVNVAVDGTLWRSTFVERSKAERKSRKPLDISQRVVRISLPPRYKYGTLYQMAVNVVPNQTVKYYC